MSSKKKKLDLEATIRLAVESCDLSLYALAKMADIDASQLSRFVRQERSISLPAAGRLCVALGLELRSVK